MAGTLEVFLGERRVGEVVNLPGDYNVFAFDDDFAADPARPILGQALLDLTGVPRRSLPRRHVVAPPFFANLLPEPGAALRDLIARRSGLRATRDFPFLSLLGEDLPGAVRLRAPNASPSHENAMDADDAETPFPSVHNAPLRFSLAGMQLKFSASIRGGRMTLPASGIGGAWIVKLPTNAYPRLPENEFSMMRLGAAIGLRVPETRLAPLHEIEGLPHELPALRRDEPPVAYAIRRFDRGDDGCVHAEDFNQIADQAPNEKYERRTLQWIAGVIRELCPAEDLDEFIARIVFGLAIGNDDMHLKNWGLIYPDGRNARLAPLYDFVCTTRYLPAGKLALTLAGERDFNAVTRETFVALAARAELSKRRTLAVMEETVERVRDVWRTQRDDLEDELAAAVDRQLRTVPVLGARR